MKGVQGGGTSNLFFNRTFGGPCCAIEFDTDLLVTQTTNNLQIQTDATLTTILSLTTGVWTFVAMTADLTSNTIGYALPQRGALSIVSAASSGGGSLVSWQLFQGIGLNGQVCGFKIWTGILSRNEILAEAQQLAPVRQRSLYAYVPLRQGWTDAIAIGHNFLDETVVGRIWNVAGSSPIVATNVSPPVPEIIPARQYFLFSTPFVPPPPPPPPPPVVQPSPQPTSLPANITRFDFTGGGGSFSPVSLPEPRRIKIRLQENVEEIEEAPPDVQIRVESLPQPEPPLLVEHRHEHVHEHRHIVVAQNKWKEFLIGALLGLGVFALVRLLLQKPKRRRRSRPRA